MPITASMVAADTTTAFREVRGARFPAWVWRELHAVQSFAGDHRSAILQVEEGSEEIVVMTRQDLDMLITSIRSEADEPQEVTV